MRIESLLVALASVVLGAVGQLFLKLGAAQLASRGRAPGLGGLALQLLANWQLLLGLGLYVASAGTWVWVLSRVNLSVAYPLVGLSFVVVLLLSAVVLRETVTLAQVAGCALILGGIVLVTQGGGPR